MSRRVPGLRFSFLVALAAAPILALACGDDDPVTPGPDASPSAAEPDAGSPLISVTFIAPKAPQAADPGDAGDAGVLPATVLGQQWVVFYPKESVDKPIVEPIADGQTVTRSMPQGAHILLAGSQSIGGGPSLSSVLEIDDVGPGESIVIGGPPQLDPSPVLQPIRRNMPSFALDGGGYYFGSCLRVDNAGAGETSGSIDARCIEPGGNARFLATRTDQAGNAVAISTAVTGVRPDPVSGEPAIVAMPPWTTPAPSTWSFSGALPDGSTGAALVVLTNTGAPGGFVVGTASPISVTAPLSFFRAPTGFNDGELHVVVSAFTVKQGVLDRSVRLSQIDRTGPTPSLATDLGTVGSYLTGFEVSATTTGTSGIDFTSSAPLPPDTTVYTLLTGSPSLDAAATNVQWITMSSKLGPGHVDTLVLPDPLRESILGDGSSWTIQGALAVSGVDPRSLRAKPLHGFLAFQYAGTGADLGLPQGNFRATSSFITPAIDH